MFPWLNFRRSVKSGLRAFGGRAWAHFPKQRLVIEPRMFLGYLLYTLAGV